MTTKCKHKWVPWVGPLALKICEICGAHKQPKRPQMERTN